MKAFVVPYGIQFSDTMAYGSHHFLTNFRFQCFAREALLFGPHFRALPGLEEQFGDVVLLTAEGYTRNLAPARLGEQVFVLTTLEAKTAGLLRFCFRVLKEDGTPVCAGFQTIVCAAKATGDPCPFPEPLERGFPLLAEATESGPEPFRDRVLRGAVKDVIPEGLQAWVRAETHPGGALDPERLAGGRLVALGSGAEPGTVLLFPGQGGYRPADHAALRALVARSPAFADCQDTLEAIVREELGVSLRAFLAAEGPAEVERLLTAGPELDQVAIYLAGALAGLARRGELGPSERVVLLGHSLGEIAALAVAGACTIEDGLRIVCRRSRTLASVARGRGGLAAVSCGKAVALEVLAASRGLAPGVALAGVNHPRQSVLAGPAAELSRLEAEFLAPRGIGLTRLRSRYPFHAPALEDVRPRFLDAIASLPLRPAAATVVSAVDGRSYAGSAAREIAERLADHLVRPFDFERMVSRLSAAGYTRWVECGVRPMLEEVVRRCGVTVEARRAAAAGPPGPAWAVVGAGCMLPGAVGVAEYERALVDGRSGIADMRKVDPFFERDFQSEGVREAKTYSALSGRVDDRAIVSPPEVDAETFRGFARQQQLLTMALAEALRSCAGPTAARLRGGDGARVLLGATADGCDEFDQALLREDLEERLAGRRADVRGLFHGPARREASALALRPSLDEAVRAACGRPLPLEILDAACASSLFAVHAGTGLLSAGRADVVVAGGVFSPGAGNSCLFSQFRGLSADGSRPFDASANGVVFGEGAVVVVLKRLEDALADGDRVLGVLRGSGLSSDGRSSSANVPRAAGQKLALERAYASAGLRPDSVQYLEAHGTATPRGDATEIESVAAVFAGRRVPLVLGSVKGQIGHTGWAAGAASLLKVCCFLREGRFPAQHGLRQASADLDRQAGLLRVPFTEEAWPAPADGEPRRAAVNGFGFGGTNAHLIVEAFVPAYHERWRSFRPAPAEKPRLVVVGRAALVPGAGGAPAPPTVEGARSFSRARIPLPVRLPMLPDLHESVDHGQLLALHAVERALASAPGLEAALTRAHAATAVVFALEGKALSGIQAGQRIHRDRLLRMAEPWAAALAPALEEVPGEPVRLGAYTLQGMMQNVVAGRIANAWDLQGPNYVLEQGEGGFGEALAHARGCLEQGCAFAIVGALHGNARFPRGRGAPVREAVGVWIVASADTARAHGLAVLAEVPDGPLTASAGAWSLRAAHDMPDLAPALRPAPRTSGFSTDAPLEVHAPTWRKVSPGAGTARVPASVLLLGGGPAARDWFHGLGCAVVDETAPADRPVELILAVEEAAALGADPFAAVARARAPFDRFAACLAARYDAIAAGRTRVVAVALGGADEDGSLEPWTGLYAGALKSLARECPRAFVGCWVSDESALPAVWGALAPSLETPGRVGERAWIRRRTLERALRISETQPSAPGALRAAGALTRDSVVVLTGGARGITAVLAEALLRRSGCRLALLGRASLDPARIRDLSGGAGPEALAALDDAGWAGLERDFYARRAGEAALPVLRARLQRLRAGVEAWATLRRLGDLAAEAGAANPLYLAADVTDPAAVNAAVEQAAESGGRLELVVHGAGVQVSRKLGRRTRADWRETLDTKVLGFGHLVAAARAACAGRGWRPPAFVALSSAFSFFGNDGQADYGAANEVLDRLCARLAAEASFTSVAWPAWDRIGMTRGPEFEALGAGRRLRGVGSEEGGRLFLDLLESARPEPVAIVCSELERALYLPPVVRELVLEPAPVTLASHPVIADHRARGSVVVPGAYLLDCVAEAALGAHPGFRVAAVGEIHFDRFARLGPEGFRYRLRVQYLDEAPAVLRLRCLVESDLTRADGHVLRAGCRFAECVLDLTRAPEPALGAATPSPAAGQTTALTDPYVAKGSPVSLGGAFDCLRDIELFQDGSRRARVEVASGAPERTAGSVLPALVLDASWRLSGMYATGDASIAVPWRFARIDLGADALAASGRGVVVRSFAPRVHGAEVVSPGFEVADAAGRLLIRGAEAVARLTAGPAV